MDFDLLTAGTRPVGGVIWSEQDMKMFKGTDGVVLFFTHYEL